mmetsp:Transcript_32834/g.78563  ORF Transcript_32834/g.78563 Transcript_32834/m.78563 type:complete len:213 (+) Transcript_32834:122-760(+)
MLAATVLARAAGSAGSHGTAGQAPPLTLLANLRPDFAVSLGPLHHLTHHHGGVVHLAPQADGCVRQALGAHLTLGVGLVHQTPRELAQQHRLGRHEGSWLGHGKSLVDNLHDLFKIEVVKDAITAQDDDVPLVGRDAVHSTAPLDDLQSQLLVEVRIHPVVHSGQLQRRLGVAIYPLHLGVKDGLQRGLPTVQSAQHKQLAVPYGQHGHHGM